MTDLPYNGTIGHAGSETSRLRAVNEDRSGRARARQNEAIMMLTMAGSQGLTWKEFADLMGMHHGQASGCLSNMHKSGRIMRLTEVRSRCKVYVLPDFVGERETETVGKTATTALMQEAARLLASGPECDHVKSGGYADPECWSCNAHRVVRHFEERGVL